MTLTAGALFILGLLLGRLFAVSRRRLLLDAFYGVILTGQGGATADDVHQLLRLHRPWPPRALYSALRQLERLGVLDGWDGHPLEPGQPQHRRFRCPASPPPGFRR